MLSRLSLGACAALLISSTAFARGAPSEKSQAQWFPAPPVRARAVVVMDATNGQVLASVNPHFRLPMASTTKIMTALVALQVGNLSDRVIVPKAAFNYESDATVMGLRPGQVVTLKDLLYGLLLPSGADAANTIAIHYGGSEARFVTMMNHEAATLGMKDTHYANAHGLTSKNHYTSAYDLADLAQYVSYVPDLMKIVSTRYYHWNGRVLTNVNKILFWYPGVDGIKPGFTDDAGICQVIDAKRDGRHIVLAVLGTPNLVTDARNLLNFGLRDYSWVQSQLPGDAPSSVQQGSDHYGAYWFFPATGHFLRGRVLTAYQHDGGQGAFGFPRTETLTEGTRKIQYFENGALATEPGTGRVSRLALGLTPLPRPSTAPKPSPTAPPATPREGSAGIPPGSGKAYKVTPTPRPAARSTSVPVPATPSSIGLTPPNAVFAGFYRTHRSMLGSAIGNLRWLKGYGIQIFAYAALAYEKKTHNVLLLPLGDRLLAARGYLAAHPGDTYPREFAPPAVLRSIGWGQYALPYRHSNLK